MSAEAAYMTRSAGNTMFISSHAIFRLGMLQFEMS